MRPESNEKRLCPKCNGEMMISYIEGIFSGIREDGACGRTETNRYMCKECGYIEEYAIDPKFYTKKRVNRFISKEPKGSFFIGWYWGWR